MSPSKPLPPGSAESALFPDIVGIRPELARHPDDSSAAPRPRAPTDQQDAPRTAMERARGTANGDFHLQESKMVPELKPAGRERGTAVGDVSREPPLRGRRPMCAGGDVTDEDGFVAVGRKPGGSRQAGPAACRQVPGGRRQRGHGLGGCRAGGCS